MEHAPGLPKTTLPFFLSVLDPPLSGSCIIGGGFSTGPMDPLLWLNSAVKHLLNYLLQQGQEIHASIRGPEASVKKTPEEFLRA